MQRFRRPVSWLAALALLLQALWPLLAHARPAEAPILLQLCTVDSVTHYIELRTGKQTPLEQRSASHGEHCKLCVFEGSKDAAVVAPEAVLYLVGEADSFEKGKHTSRPRPFTAAPAQPRGPPAVL